MKPTTIIFYCLSALLLLLTGGLFGWGVYFKFESYVITLSLGSLTAAIGTILTAAWRHRQAIQEQRVLWEKRQQEYEQQVEELKNDLKKERGEEERNQQEQEEQVIQRHLQRYQKVIKKARPLKKRAEELLSKLGEDFEGAQGAFFITKGNNGTRILEFIAGYAFHLPASETLSYEFGEGLTGQAAVEKELFNISDLPENSLKVFSGLGESSPNHLIIVPFVHNNQTQGVMELASFKKFDSLDEKIFQQLQPLVGEVIQNSKNRKNEKTTTASKA